jgi:hypothetical protein
MTVRTASLLLPALLICACGSDAPSHADREVIETAVRHAEQEKGKVSAPPGSTAMGYAR